MTASHEIAHPHGGWRRASESLFGGNAPARDPQLDGVVVGAAFLAASEGDSVVTRGELRRTLRACGFAEDVCAMVSGDDADTADMESIGRLVLGVDGLAVHGA